MWLIWEKIMCRAIRKDTVYEIWGFCIGVVQGPILWGCGSSRTCATCDVLHVLEDWIP
jgi:hypothetical protein